jgi:hypothetical protein
MKVIDRFKSPTPKFFKTLRNIGLVLVAAGGVLVAAPVAGSVATAISQAVTKTEDKREQSN